MVIIKRGNVNREKAEKERDLKIKLIEDSCDEDVRIELLIRKGYSLSEELALHRKKMAGLCEETEWNEYNAYVQKCIEKARTSIEG